jgi:polysaccharide pyruvyl transferase WcaK-like protein
MVRYAFDSLGDVDINWHKRQVWQAVSETDVQQINREYDAIVIGGGGLLLRDQKGADASASGWQWNCSLAALKLITVPIIVFAIGYNRFRDQDDFLGIFDEHIATLIDRSAFFSVRNHGSIEKLKAHLPSSLLFKIKKQSCPTTIISRLNPRWSGKRGSNSHRVAVNAAFDRINLRVAGGKDHSFRKFNAIIDALKLNNFEPVIVAHKEDDTQIIEYLEKANQGIPLFNLTDKAYEEVIEFYSTVCLSVGMRGHSQMIPLGMGIPIFSVITHDKMRYLLDDIMRPKWGAELASDTFIGSFNDFLRTLIENKEQVRKDIDAIVNTILDETAVNIEAAVRSIK